MKIVKVTHLYYSSSLNDMAYQKATNGLLKHLYEINEAMLEAIAKEYKLEIEDVREVAYKAVDNSKQKSIKLQARLPKRTGAPGNREGKRKTGYTLWQDENRAIIVQSLIDDEDTRTFKNSKTGKKIVIDESDFKNDKPTFPQIAQKCASVWKYDVTTEEKEEFSRRAGEINLEPVKKNQKEKRNPKGSKSKASATEEEEEEEADEEEVEGEEEEEEEEPKKKSHSKKNNPPPKKQVSKQRPRSKSTSK